MFCTDNDRPTLSTSSNVPVEGADSVTLKCTEFTSAYERVITYEWYKDDSKTKVPNENESIYQIGYLRSGGGNYTCKVVAANSGSSIQSAPQAIAFYCKFDLHFSMKVVLYLYNNEN